MEEVLAKNDLTDGKNGQQREMIRSVPLSLIDDIPEHPYKIKDEEEMEDDANAMEVEHPWLVKEPRELTLTDKKKILRLVLTVVIPDLRK